MRERARVEWREECSESSAGEEEEGQQRDELWGILRRKTGTATEKGRAGVKRERDKEGVVGEMERRSSPTSRAGLEGVRDRLTVHIGTSVRHEALRMVVFFGAWRAG